MISQELLKELQIILREDYGRDLKMKKVSEIGNNIVRLFSLLEENYQLYHDDLQKNRLGDENGISKE